VPVHNCKRVKLVIEPVIT